MNGRAVSRDAARATFHTIMSNVFAGRTMSAKFVANAPATTHAEALTVRARAEPKEGEHREDQGRRFS